MCRRLLSVSTIVLLTVIAAPTAVGSELEKKYDKLHDATTKEFGYKVVGRDIVRYGMPTKKKVRPFGWSTYLIENRPATKAEINTSIDRMNAWLNPPQLVATSQSVPVQGTRSAPNGHLASIAACESGGNPSAIGGGGAYRGKYQFSPSTWQSVGGSGDPAAAPEAEQDMRAAILYAKSGPSQWPVCGG